MDTRLKLLPEALLRWYRENRRQLPWRADKEPYHVWLSEIMLQQTRVEAVKDYYIRFLQELPTICALAACDEERLHKLWEGLGYYSRVRNLKKAAQIIEDTYGGVFPGKYSQILALPGIGAYTAGAICSICFDQPTPAVDGNVLRVVARITDDATPIDLPPYKKQVQDALAQIYPKQAGDFTQALMELGATVCGPNKKPECQVCPCRLFCLGHSRGTMEQLPKKMPKKQRRTEEKTVFILHCDGHYALTKRPKTGLLAGLWQFPDAPEILDARQAIATIEQMGLQVTQLYRQSDRTHIFTHVQWNMRGYYLDIQEPKGDFRWLTAEQLEEEAALPTAYRQFWEK